MTEFAILTGSGLAAFVAGIVVGALVIRWYRGQHRA